MSYYEFSKYVSVAEKKLKAQKSIEKLRKKNPDITPVVIEGRKLTKTWWGTAWNNNLESYSDYANRIDRGRSYVRHGAIIDLKIVSGKVSALVLGSQKKPYQVDVSIEPLGEKNWNEIKKSCAGKIHSLQSLVDGKFPEELSDLFTAHGKGLFPSPKEITLQCSCLDWAVMCKHVAAVLYGVGARLDENPTLFFLLRSVDINELISKAVQEKSRTLIKKSGKRSGRIIENDDLSSVFGIEMDTHKPDAEKLSK